MARILAGRDTIAPGAPGASRRNTPYDRGVGWDKHDRDCVRARTRVRHGIPAHHRMLPGIPGARAQAQTAPDDETPAGFCAVLLDDLERLLGGREEAVWGRFVAWAGEQPTVPCLFWLLAAEVAAAHGDWPGALELATAALPPMQRPIAARRISSAGPAAPSRPRMRWSARTRPNISAAGHSRTSSRRPTARRISAASRGSPFPSATTAPRRRRRSGTHRPRRRSALDPGRRLSLLQQDPLLVSGQPPCPNAAR